MDRCRHQRGVRHYMSYVNELVGRSCLYLTFAVSARMARAVLVGVPRKAGSLRPCASRCLVSLLSTFPAQRFLLEKAFPFGFGPLSDGLLVLRDGCGPLDYVCAHLAHHLEFLRVFLTVHIKSRSFIPLPCSTAPCVVTN